MKRRIRKSFFIKLYTVILSTANIIIPKKKTRIVLYSNLGFRDNVKALYLHLIQHGFNENYKIICVSNEFYELNTNGIRNVKRVGIARGFYYFLTSKYFFYCFGNYLIKPSRSQTVVNLWHGMPIKRIGNMEKNQENIDFNFFSFVIYSSEMFEKIIQQSFNTCKSQLFMSGSPRNDSLTSAVKKKKQIVWMPTYRENTKEILPFINNLEELKEIDNLMSRCDYKLVIKQHPLHPISFSENNMESIDIIDDNILSKRDLELYDLLATSEALITDYSSVSLDYLLLNNPIGYTINDLTDYKNSRGFNFEPVEQLMAGERINTLVELIEFLKNVINGNDRHAKERELLNRKVNPKNYSEGNCERILELCGIRSKK